MNQPKISPTEFGALIANAELPPNHQAAIKALRRCYRDMENWTLEEIKAVLADLEQDNQLENNLLITAMRIRGRAVRKCAPLFRELCVHPEAK